MEYYNYVVLLLVRGDTNQDDTNQDDTNRNNTNRDDRDTIKTPEQH